MFADARSWTVGAREHASDTRRTRFTASLCSARDIGEPRDPCVEVVVLRVLADAQSRRMRDSHFSIYEVRSTIILSTAKLTDAECDNENYSSTYAEG